MNFYKTKQINSLDTAISNSVFLSSPGAPIVYVRKIEIQKNPAVCLSQIWLAGIIDALSLSEGDLRLEVSCTAEAEQEASDHKHHVERPTASIKSTKTGQHLLGVAYCL